MLKTRIITALVLAVGMGIALFLENTLWWQGLFLVAVFAMGYEWSGFAKVTRKINKLIWGSSFVLSVIVLDAFLTSIIALNLLLVIPLVVMIAIVVIFQRKHAEAFITNPVWLYLLGILVVFPFYHAIISMKLNFSPQLILLSFFTIWAIDTGAYFSGRKFGKTKLASFVSPGKSWEGVYGGVLLSFIVAYVGLIWIQPSVNISYVALALILGVIAALSVFGDLFESVLKRQVNMKDSSQILPGHGGVLDRLDSLILAMPLYLLTWQMVIY